MQIETDTRNNHRADLHDLRPDGDLTFAESIGEPPTSHAEQDERYGEKKSYDRDERFALARLQAHRHDHRQEQIAKDVVAERTLELCRDQRPKAARAAFHGNTAG